jgi:hypothetical protein
MQTFTVGSIAAGNGVIEPVACFHQLGHPDHPHVSIGIEKLTTGCAEADGGRQQVQGRP